MPMDTNELTAHRAAVLAAWQRHQQAAAEVPAVSDTLNGHVIPVSERAHVLSGLVAQREPWSDEQVRFIRAEARRQLGV